MLKFKVSIFQCKPVNDDLPLLTNDNMDKFCFDRYSDKPRSSTASCIKYYQLQNIFLCLFSCIFDFFRCPQSSKSSSIVMTRKLQQSNHYSPIISQKRNPPRLITGRDMEIYTPVISVTLFCISNIPVEWSKDGEKVIITLNLIFNDFLTVLR